ncbi:hypothetical protein EW146_g8627 [Bondarzewia mesenterica]|uniref:Cytochrome P450 n=1 Tax=Bondarzewia mesenterica TaxID=1095465 RepID=A0A4S4LD65_9AGAM|nr:hypothetical protein EW146_g8627 [Bondarzewia mesenterica]
MHALGTDNFIPVVATAASLLLALAGIISKRARRPPLPPGPKSSLFGLGSLWTPTSFPWRTYAEWRSLYGDMIYIYAFGNPILILNSAKAAEELLDKRGSIYSSRPVRTMKNLMGGDFFVLVYAVRERVEEVSGTVPEALPLAHGASV